MAMTRKEFLASAASVGALSACAGTRFWLPRKDSLRCVRYTAKDYVQDGLVAMWDGIENVGWGNHSGDSTIWKDLIGNVDLSIGDNGLFELNALKCLSGSDYAASSQESVLTSNTQYEICLHCDTPYNDSINRVVACFGRSFSFGLSFERNLGLLFRGITNIFTYDFGNKSGTYSKNTSDSEPFYVDSNSITQRHDSDTWENFTEGIYIGNYVNGIRPFVGKIYCIRIYNRSLTVGEMSKNYAIDKARFNLP